MNKQNKPKSQHFLPQMFLKGFTTASGQIYMLDNQKKTVQLRNPESVAKEKHMYTIFGTNEKDFRVEEHYSRIENESADLFKNISAGGLDAIHGDEIDQLINFIVTTFCRTPRATKVSEEVIKDPGVQEMLKDKDITEAEKYIRDCLDNKGYSYAMTLDQHFEYRFKVLTHNFDAVFVTAEAGSPPFIINDQFSCLEIIQSAKPFKIEYFENGKDVDWGKMNVKKHFPISNKHCVTFVPKVNASRKGVADMLFLRETVKVRDINIINSLTLQQMKRYAYSSFDGHLKELVK